MNDVLALGLALTAGLALGAFFFGGLWWTVRRSLSSKRVALWFLGSMVLRTALVLLGFYAVAGGSWQRLLTCLSGFVIARLVVIRLTRVPEQQTQIPQEPGHAS